MLSLEETSLPWVEKYRPKSLDHIACHGATVKTIRAFISENRLPHLFFYGPPGSGKTSMAMAIASSVYGPNWKSTGCVLELNASDERGIGAVRDQIKTFCSAGTATFSHSLASGRPPPKLVLLDEADAMTSAAQNALRRIIEKYVQRVRFIIIGNYAGQIIPALQSRCTKFRFEPLRPKSMSLRLQHVVDSENLVVSGEAQSALIELAEGDMRKVLNWLQAAYNARQTALAPNGPGAAGAITVDDIYSVSSSTDPRELQSIWETALREDVHETYSRVLQARPLNGLSLGDLIRFSAKFVLGDSAKFSASSVAYLFSELAVAEQRCAAGCSEDIQLASVISTISTFGQLNGLAC